jgi:hypothetical protein
MDATLGEPDHRAVVIGALVGAAATVAMAVLGDDWVEIVVLGSGVASVLAGVVAVHASRERMQPFREGAYAAVSGLLGGVGVWMVGVSVVTPADSLDVFLLLTPFGFVAAFVALPMSFFVGGVAGYATLMSGV